MLLDTCTFLWIISDDSKLSKRARDIYTEPENDIYLSAASTWEISIKYSIGRLPLPGAPEQFIPEMRNQHDITSLPIEEMETFYLSKLPKLHKDPFDRILICQAIVNSMIVLTPDELISQYPLQTYW